MALVCRRLDASSEPQDWLRVEEAARLTSESVRNWRRRAQAEASEATRCGRELLAQFASAPGSKGRPTWWVHRSLHPKLSRCSDRQTRDERVREALLAKHPQHVVTRALRRNHWLQRWRTLCERRTDSATDRQLAGQVVNEARSVEGLNFRISVRSLYQWRHRYTRLDGTGSVRSVRGVEGLIDRYGTSKEDSPTRSPEAIACFYELYRTENKLAVALCHDVTLRQARRNGWQWPESYRATASWLQEHDNRSLTYLMREGRRRWAHKFLPYVHRDWSRIEVGEWYVCDHAQCDFWVLYKKRQIRPWLTAIEDCRTRCIVGWYLGPVPHSDAIIAALRRAFRDWAIPGKLYIDNGKDFTCKAIGGVTKRERDHLRRTLGPDWQQKVKLPENLIDINTLDPRWLGITGELGIQTVYAIPYSPQSKPIERWFGTFHGQCGKTFATYAGNTPTSRPECVDRIRADDANVVTLDQARERIAEYLDVYHRTPHRGLNRNTPLGEWKTATRLRRAVADELAFLMDVRGLYKVSANGVRVSVGSASIFYGAKSAALKRWGGRQVLIALDQTETGYCWAFTPDRDKRQLIARLDANEYIVPGTNTDDVREVIAEKKREQAAYDKVARASHKRTKRMVARLNEHSREKRAELLATGTDDDQPQARIVPIRTGFEVASKGSRSAFENDPFRPEDSGDLEDLFVPQDSGGADEDDEQDMDDLFVVESSNGEASDEGLDDLR